MSEGRSTFNSAREEEFKFGNNEENSDSMSDESGSQTNLSEIRRRMFNPTKGPYSKCVSQLGLLVSDKTSKAMQTPMEKMDCITEISSHIKTEVQDFWDGVEVDPRKLTLDA